MAAPSVLLEYAFARRFDFTFIHTRGKIMRNLGWVVVGLGLAFCSASAQAQQAAAPASGPVTNPITTMVKSQLPRFEKNMVGAA
jgi:hypothetical protein